MAESADLSNARPAADEAALSAQASLPAPDSPGAFAATAPLPLTQFLDEPNEPAPTQLTGKILGLIEAGCWSGGVFAAHLFAGVVLMAVLVVAFLASGGRLQDLLQIPVAGASGPGGEVAPAAGVGLLEENMPFLIGGDQMLVLLLTVLAIGLRFGTQTARTLNLHAPHPLHLLIVCGLMLPLSTVGGEVYRVALASWQEFTDVWPFLRALDESNAVEALEALCGQASLPLLLLFVAVAPGIGEELIFRGAVGRALVRHWGILPGVLMTSLLFAAVHFHPAHVVGVIPIGIALHLVYLSTRSLWAPMLLHFLNNAWATVAAKMSATEWLQSEQLNAPASPTLLFASITAIVVLGALLWRTRARYVLPNGQEWTPGYVTVEAPPPGVAAELQTFDLCHRSLITALSAWAAFGVAFVAEIVAFAR